MPEFTFWYTETQGYRAWFTADSLEQARELLGKVECGELDMEELPEFGSKTKYYELTTEDIDIAVYTIAESPETP